ncbi:hypothetical protein CH371_10310 [Leptospira wolffii]|uniref:DUF3157 family protein n=1 Tax=Leptospira wolffii TaxID=409998 RepID=A0A2M9ZBU7_9LEPT|nr:DUF3157 family protein [Leptospira wolffii]PJZ65916.1 hypothetical protein CH371_10310 [Leptospira wolffii]
MKKILTIILFSTPLLSVFAEEVFTKTGRKVILKDDFTWHYAEESKSKSGKNVVTPTRTLTKTNDMVASVSNKSGFYKVFYNPEQWALSKEANEVSEFHFINIAKSGNAMVLFDGIEIPLEAFPNLLLFSVNKTDPDARIMQLEDIVVNGTPGKLVTYRAQTRGLTLIFHSFITSNPKGSIQFSTFTLENQFEKERENFEKLISGLVLN